MQNELQISKRAADPGLVTALLADAGIGEFVFDVKGLGPHSDTRLLVGMSSEIARTRRILQR